MNYFKSQRCSDHFDRKDRKTRFYSDSHDLNTNSATENNQTVDLSGGMIYWRCFQIPISPSYANDMNPQQTPMVVWNLAKSHELVRHEDELAQSKLQEKIQAEATHGAAFGSNGSR